MPIRRGGQRLTAEIDKKEAAKRRFQELKRQEKESNDAALAQNKARMDIKAKRESDEDELAKTLKPVDVMQPEVFARLCGKLTLPLGQLVRHIGNRGGQRTAWVCVSKPTARDILQRAYGIALQIGLVCTPRDDDNTLTFPNGSKIEFTWPDKPLPRSIGA